MTLKIATLKIKPDELGNKHWNRFGQIEIDWGGHTLAKVFPKADELGRSTADDVADAEVWTRLFTNSPRLVESLLAMLTFEEVILTHRPSAVYTLERAKEAVRRAIGGAD